MAATSTLLRAAEILTTPLVPTDYLDLFAPLRNPTAMRGRLEAVQPETRDAATLVIRPGRGWLGHVPGQYVRVGVDVDGVRRWRAYSLTGTRPDGCFTITVKAIPEGVVSNHLVRRARAGTVVQLDQACGDFVVPTPRPRKVLFVTAGSGVTPVMGMLRAHGEALGDVVLVHAAPSRDDVIFGEELRLMAAAGRIRLVEHHDDVHGLLSTDRLVREVADIASREAWACGPTGLLDVLEELYDERGWSDLLHTERFRPTVVTPGEGGTLTFTGSGNWSGNWSGNGSGRTIEADGATTILDAGESAGVLMPSGCRMGICFGCVLPLRQGAVRDLRNGEITVAAPGDDVKIQTCISAAAGDCHIDV